MIPKQAIARAIEGGYKIDLDWFADLPIYAHAQIVIDPIFWQALIKKAEFTFDMIWECPLCASKNGGHEPWLWYSHRFVSLVLTNGDIEKFWKELLK